MNWRKLLLVVLCVFLLTLWSVYAALDHDAFRLPLVALLLGGCLAGWCALRFIGSTPSEPSLTVTTLGEWFRPWQLGWAGAQAATLVATIVMMSKSRAYAQMVGQPIPNSAAVMQLTLYYGAGGISVFLVGCAMLNRLLRKRPGADTLYCILMGLLTTLCLVHLYVPGLINAILGPLAELARQRILEQLQGLE